MNKHPQVITVRIDTQEPLRLDKALVKLLPKELDLSRSRITKLIKAGNVHLQEKTVTSPSYMVMFDQVLEITLPPINRSELAPENIPLNVVYEDSDIIVVDKPVGLVVHPGAGNPSSTLVNALIHHCGCTMAGVGGQLRPGIVHRLDKDTSGLIVAAKSDKAMHSLTQQFAAKTAQRSYFALVHGHPKASSVIKKRPWITFESDQWIKIETLIGRHSNNRVKFSVHERFGKSAVTRYRVVNTYFDEKVSAIECKLETGRTHQIRVHMEFIDHPILGDQTYAGGRQVRKELSEVLINQNVIGQALRAVKLEFNHPTTGRALQFEVPLNRELKELIDILNELSHD